MDKRTSKKRRLLMIFFHVLLAHLRAIIWLLFAREYNYYKLFIFIKQSCKGRKVRIQEWIEAFGVHLWGAVIRAHTTQGRLKKIGVQIMLSVTCVEVQAYDWPATEGIHAKGQVEPKFAGMWNSRSLQACKRAERKQAASLEVTQSLSCPRHIT